VKQQPRRKKQPRKGNHRNIPRRKSFCRHNISDFLRDVPTIRRTIKNILLNGRQKNNFKCPVCGNHLPPGRRKHRKWKQQLRRAIKRRLRELGPLDWNTYRLVIKAGLK